MGLKCINTAQFLTVWSEFCEMSLTTRKRPFSMMKTWTFETYISVFVLYIYLSKIFNSLLLLVIRHLIGYCCYFYFRKGFKHLDLSCNQNLVQLLLVVFVRVRSADDLHVGCQPVVSWQEAKIGHPLVSCGFLPHQNNKLNLTYILLPLLPVFALSCRLIVQSSARTSLWLTQVVFVLTDCLTCVSWQCQHVSGLDIYFFFFFKQLSV